jgi:hypothetical protein
VTCVVAGAVCAKAAMALKEQRMAVRRSVFMRMKVGEWLGLEKSSTSVGVLPAAFTARRL